MPNSTLPGNTYLGDGQRTTSEMQDGLDQVAAWLNAAQAELNALTGTTFGEAAVRGVGTGDSDLVETSELDTRLGTEGNLSGLGDFDPTSPTSVWTGSSILVAMTDLSSQGPGLYILKVNNVAYPVHIGDSSIEQKGSSGIVAIDSSHIEIAYGYYTSAFFGARLVDFEPGATGTSTALTITEILKV